MYVVTIAIFFWSDLVSLISWLLLSAQNVPDPCSRYNQPFVTKSPIANLTVCRLTPNSFINSLSELIFWCGVYVPFNILDFTACFTMLYLVVIKYNLYSYHLQLICIS